jgi:hypothetical protein
MEVRRSLGWPHPHAKRGARPDGLKVEIAREKFTPTVEGRGSNQRVDATDSPDCRHELMICAART